MATPDGPSDIVASFRHPTIPSLHAPDAEPTYATIKIAIKALGENATSVRTTLGDGRLGHLGLVIGPANYAHVSAGGAAWAAPANPGPNPVVPAGATAAQITEIRRQHTINQKTYQTYVDTDAALKAQLLKATDDRFTSAQDKAA